jgi:hypothetical protein
MSKNINNNNGTNMRKRMSMGKDNNIGRGRAA